MSEDRNRWSKFWWQDWQRDPALRTCSPAARGAWMDLLAIAHEGAPYGHVTINGKPPKVQQLARIIGVSDKEAQRLIEELRDAGVFSETSSGVIYSRRMERDFKAAQAGREHIAKRWESKKSKAEEPNSDGGSAPSGNSNSSPNEEPTELAASPPNRGPNSLYSEADTEKKEPPSLRSAPTASPREKPHVPDWMPTDAWNGFVAMRKSIRKPLTDRAIELLVRQLDGFRSRGISVEAALNNSTIGNYQGVFEPKRQRAQDMHSPGMLGALEAYDLVPVQSDDFFADPTEPLKQIRFNS